MMILMMSVVVGLQCVEGEEWEPEQEEEEEKGEQ